MKNHSLKDHVVVVTGGSRGIGKAIAVLLAKNGANIVICSRKEEDLKKVSALINSNNGKCDYVVADVSDEKQVVHLAAEVMRIYGKIDILINNAGVGIYKSLLDSTLEDWDNIINTNLRGPFLCCRAFTPFMIKQRKGQIVNIISGAGKAPKKNMSIYCTSKFGLAGLAQSMKKELSDFPIKILNFYPGYVRTAFFKNFPEHFHLPSTSKEPEAVAQELLNSMTGRNKLKHFFNKTIDRFKSLLRN
jgi:NAD(P)-dependent dehydrogenase (short-subunit alcohol dehydrogenase family)